MSNMESNPASVPISGVKRKSRFERGDDIAVSNNGNDPSLPDAKRSQVDISAAAAKAAELSKSLAARMAASSTSTTAPPPAVMSAGLPRGVPGIPISATGFLPPNVPGIPIINVAALQKPNTEKKHVMKTLRLDAQGREIDEHGNLVVQEVHSIKTLQANIQSTQVPKKKENPYLAHHKSAAPPVVVPPNAVVPGLTAGTATPFMPPVGTAVPAATEAAAAPSQEADEVFDDRLPQRRRDLKAKRALQFVESGKYIKEAVALQEKEERKIIAGYSSGRKTLQNGGDALGVDEEVVAVPAEQVLVPPLPETIIPAMEWWDEVFLPKQKREQRKISKAAADVDEYDLANIQYCKTHIYVQHPVPVKPLGMITEKSIVTMPTYLTKKERKKLRKATRAEREQEKRDKMMLGLISAPEPKFKLSNFMKILGDQAVADPSKVELRVLQQMQQRVLNHEMRNQANKLTPKERKEKKMKKLQEDVSRGVTVAVFRVTDFSCLKYRFKVDVNAQQLFLSGLVLLCPEEGKNLVVVEGGPKGIRKFTHLMTKRIPWEVYVPNTNEITAVQNGEEWNYASNAVADEHSVAHEDDDDEDDEEDEEDDNEDDEEEDEGDSVQQKGNGQQSQTEHGYGPSGGRNPFELPKNVKERRCDLLWQGVIPKRMFTGLKFQESKTSQAARKMLEGKNAAHYWDFVTNADQIIASAATDDLF